MKDLHLKYYLRNVISIKTEILPNERIIKYEGNLKGTMIGYLTCDCEPLAPLKPIKKNEFNAFALMEKFGWKKSMGLGKDLRGNPNPITIIEKKVLIQITLAKRMKQMMMKTNLHLNGFHVVLIRF